MFDFCVFILYGDDTSVLCIKIVDRDGGLPPGIYRLIKSSILVFGDLRSIQLIDCLIPIDRAFILSVPSKKLIMLLLYF